MILVDTAIWIDHLARADEMLHRLLDEKRVVVHPFVIGEVALGTLRQREKVLDRLSLLPATRKATDDQVLWLINSRQLFATGIGFVDAHLVAATLLTTGASLWTRDERLHAVAERLGIAARLPN